MKLLSRSISTLWSAFQRKRYAKGVSNCVYHEESAAPDLWAAGGSPAIASVFTGICLSLLWSFYSVYSFPNSPQEESESTWMPCTNKNMQKFPWVHVPTSSWRFACVGTSEPLMSLGGHMIFPVCAFQMARLTAESLLSPNERSLKDINGNMTIPTSLHGDIWLPTAHLTTTNCHSRPKSPLHVCMRRFRSPSNTSWFIKGHTGLIYGCCGRHLKVQWTPRAHSLSSCGFSSWHFTVSHTWAVGPLWASLFATLSCPRWFGHLEVHKESHMSLCGRTRIVSVSLRRLQRPFHLSKLLIS